MPVSTRGTTRSGTQDGQNSRDSQQSNEASESSIQEPTQRQNSDIGIDVHQPMGLRQMQEIIDNQPLSIEQLRVLTDRIRELVRARAGKRAHEDADDEDDMPRKRRADHDLKYDNIEKLRLGASLKAWSDWKMEIQRAFRGAPYKYDNDCAKVIKAVSHLDGDCKALWNNHVRETPEDEENWEAFISWVNTTTRDQGNDELATQAAWARAKQKFDQPPWAFDAYLTSLEREMEPKTERTRSMEFFTKLRPNLQREIRRTGMNPLPQTKQAMVSLATRLWENIKDDEQDPSKRDPKSSTRERPEKPERLERPENKGENRPREPKGPKEFASGINDRGQRTCYTCGSTEHLARYHKEKKDDERDTEQRKPGVHAIKTVGQKQRAEKAWDSLSDSSDDD